jgi:hypothetical protein
VDSTDQRNGFRLPWSAPAGVHQERAAAPGGDADPAAAPAQNRFQPILLRAMRAAAEDSRNAMLVACQEEATAVVTGLHARSANDSEALRRVAGIEIAETSESAKAEIARISAEADQAVAARRARLSQSLEEGATRVELEIDAVRSRVAAFEADMVAFFGRLESVADPAQFASLTAQMPEPPQLRGADDLGVVPTVEAAPARPTPDPAARDAATAVSAKPAPPAAPQPAKAPVLVPSPDKSLPSRTQVTEMAPPSAAAPSAESSVPPVVAPASASEASTETPAARVPGAPVTATTVVVVGLVNIASIASFKRHVSGLHGVRSVAVSSSPGGEFVFKVTHDPDLPLGDEVTLLPDFGARIVESEPGLLKVAARDPGASA